MAHTARSERLHARHLDFGPCRDQKGSRRPLDSAPLRMKVKSHERIVMKPLFCKIPKGSSIAARDELADVSGFILQWNWWKCRAKKSRNPRLKLGADGRWRLLLVELWITSCSLQLVRSRVWWKNVKRATYSVFRRIRRTRCLVCLREGSAPAEGSYWKNTPLHAWVNGHLNPMTAFTLTRRGPIRVKRD